MAEDGKEKNPRLATYLEAIAAYEREFKKWEGRVEKILKRYRDERRDSGGGPTKFNILWANEQTLRPACFSQLPKPDVTRRFRDNDPVGRVAALILERALEYEVQHYVDFRKTLKSAVRARFLGGRGTAWARYEPRFKEEQLQITEDVEEIEVQEQLDYECAPTDYVNYKDFGHSVARCWEEVTLVWRKVYMSKKAVEKRFGKEIAKKIPYDSSPQEENKSPKAAQEQPRKQACIYELWDKDESTALWISKSYPEIIDERPDPLNLQDFFPCPEPLYATMTEDTLQPVPDFTIYQDQARALDTLADRIHGLAEMLQVKGVYDASADASVSRIFKEGMNGDLLPVKNWTAFAEKQGLKGQIDVLDLKMIADALKTAVEAFAQKKGEVDELSGVIDVLRGEVDPKEKLGQTQMKGQYANLRLRDKQQEVAEFATGLLRLKGQIICGKFNPKTIMAMAAVEQLSPEDQQYIGPAMELLVGQERLQDPKAEGPNPLRSFRIEIAADTLVQIDEAAEKQAATEFLTAVGGFIDKAAQVGAVAPQLIPLLLELLKWGITRFKVGKNVEGTIDTAIEQLKQMVQQQMANPQPNPEVQAQQAKTDAEKQKGQIQVQTAQAKAQVEMEKLRGKQQMQQQQMQLDAQQQQQDMAMQQQQGAMDQQMMQQDMQMQQEQGAMKRQQMHDQMHLQQQQGHMKLQQSQAQHQQKMKQAKQQPKQSRNK